MNATLEEAITATLRAPRPRPEFVAGLLASIAAGAPGRLALLPAVEAEAHRVWVLAGTMAGAAGLALIGWRLVRRGAA